MRNFMVGDMVTFTEEMDYITYRDYINSGEVFEIIQINRDAIKWPYILIINNNQECFGEYELKFAAPKKGQIPLPFKWGDRA